MKNIKSFMVIIALLVAGTAVSSYAQGKPKKVEKKEHKAEKKVEKKEKKKA